MKTELACKFEVAPKHLTGNPNRGEFGERPFAENIECFGPGKTLRRGSRQL
jgi:hypothetical protein